MHTILFNLFDKFLYEARSDLRVGRADCDGSGTNVLFSENITEYIIDLLTAVCFIYNIHLGQIVAKCRI